MELRTLASLFQCRIANKLQDDNITSSNFLLVFSKGKEATIMSQFCFKVYEHNLVIDDQRLITRKFIVLKDADRHILSWTDYHKYIVPGKYRTTVN